MIAPANTDGIPVHGGQLRKISEQFGISPEKLLDFSANLNPDGPPESVVNALKDAVCQKQAIREYPDSEYSRLKKAFGSYAGISTNTLVVANGVIPLLEAAIRATGVGKCFLPVPSFSEYRRVLGRCNVEVVSFPVSPEEHFRMNVDRILEEMRRLSCDAFLLANPQNPSGTLLPREELQVFLREAIASGIHVFLDEAFIDYIPEESLTSWISSVSQIVIFRSITKFFAMAGMRVAFAVANSGLARKIERDIPEWPVTELAAASACAALEDWKFVEETLHRNRTESLWLQEQLRSVGLKVYPGMANYLLFKLPDGILGEDIWRRLISESHLVVRCCSNFDSLDKQFLRVAVRKRDDNRKLVDGLSRLLDGKTFSMSAATALRS